jgi:LPXTG-site transpeptidase (sortase) family protein
MQNQDHGIIGNIAKNPIAFAIAFVAFFLVTVWFLGLADALPEPSKENTSEAHASTSTVVETPVAQPQVKVTAGELPVRVVAAKIGLNVSIKNPSSTNVDVLDEALLSGSVRYPGSAKLGENGTVLLFGHSSYLPVVHNLAYKAFDGIQNLKAGRYGERLLSTLEYRYAVEKVVVANADEDVVELRKDAQYLTLVTCDSFTKKTDRFIMTAKFVGAYPLASN